jgi:hypothetical protein
MTVTVAGLPFSFVQASLSAGMTGFFFKSTKDAYYYDVATSTLTKVTSANYPTTTVPGAVYLDGTYYVMDSTGNIKGSALNDPLTWDALNSIEANMTSNNPVALVGFKSYVLAFMQNSLSFFYDANNPTGSPLLPYTSANFGVGCASAGSIATMAAESNSAGLDTIYWMGLTGQTGRSIYRFDGTGAVPVSTPFEDKILGADDLSTVYSFCIRTGGHQFYVLTLVQSGITLAYDAVSQQWTTWTSLTPQATKSVTSLTWANGTVTATATAHGYSDGDPVVIAGASPSGYNGTFNITYVSANSFTYPVSTTLTTPATGTITAMGYTSSYFGGGFYTSAGGLDVIQWASTGDTYAMTPAALTDFGSPVDCKIRTANWDGGTSEEKQCATTELIGDKVTSTAILRYTNDDYQTFSTYRPVPLSWPRSILNRCGRFYRRAWELRHTDSTAFRAESLELDLNKGTK